MDTQTAFLMLAVFTTGLVVGRLTMAIQYEVMRGAAESGAFKMDPSLKPVVQKPRAPKLHKVNQILQ